MSQIFTGASSSSTTSASLVCLYTKGAEQLNVTGEGTTANVIFYNRVSDPNNTYDNSTGIFTAQTAGIYYFNTEFTIDGVYYFNDYCIMGIYSPDSPPISAINGHDLGYVLVGTRREPITSSMGMMTSLSPGNTVLVSAEFRGTTTKNVSFSSGDTNFFSCYKIA